MKVPDPSERAVITVEEAAKLLGISRSSAYVSIHKGEIPVVKYGRRYLVPVAALRRQLGYGDAA